MNVLIDLQHPAHLHFFRNLVARLKADGHEVRITGRDKDILVELAENYGIEVEIFGRARKGLVNLGREFFCRQWRLLGVIREFKPDVMMAVAGTFISPLGRLAGIPVYVFYDTEHAAISNLIAYPTATRLYVPQCYRREIRRRHVRYNGYHELAYLHPKYFTPDSSVLDEVGVKQGDVFTVVRFVAWAAAHDIGRKGFSLEGKLRAVEELSRHGRVFISSEAKLPRELEPYRLRLNVARIHHFMAHAALIFGESATMASEGAVLGVPGIYVDPVGRGYTNEQEREYGLVFNFTPDRQDDAVGKAVEILSNYRPEDWRAKGKRLVKDKIDVTGMVYGIVSKEFARA